MREQKTTRYIKYALYLTLFSFLFNGMWEWLQSPLYRDISMNFNDIVKFRLHCTIVDIRILWGGVLLNSLLRRRLKWIFELKLRDYIMVTLFGVAYTFWSEWYNVYKIGAWAYSQSMPVVTGLKIGVAPLVQWFILPSIILKVTKDHIVHSSTFEEVR